MFKWTLHLVDCSTTNIKPNESMKLIVATFVGIVFGFFLGISYPTLSTKVQTLGIFFFGIAYAWVNLNWFFNLLLDFMMELLHCLPICSWISYPAYFPPLTSHTLKTNMQVAMHGLSWRIIAASHQNISSQMIHWRYTSHHVSIVKDFKICWVGEG